MKLPALFRSRKRPVPVPVPVQRRMPTVARRREFNTDYEDNGQFGLPIISGGLQPVDQALSYALSAMRASARTAYQNSPLARRSARVTRDYVVGPHGTVLRSEEAIERAWELHSRAPTFEVSGRFSRYEVERSVMLAVLVDGESFLRLHPGGLVEVIDAPRIPAQRWLEDATTGITVRMGIAFQRETMRPVAYYLAPVLSGSISYVTAAYQQGTLAMVPASAMLHLFDTQLDSSRGWPAFSTAVGTMYGVEKYSSSELTSAQINSRHVGIVTRNTYGYGIKPNTADENADSSTGHGFSYDPQRVIDDDDLSMLELPDGSSFDQMNTGAPRSRCTGFEAAMIRNVARGSDTPYSALAADYANASFSALRAERIDAQTAWQSWQTLLIARVIRPCFEHWLRHALMTGQIAGYNIGDYVRLATEAEFVGWQPPFLQPREEARAAAEKIKAGVMSRSEYIRKNGGSPERVFSEIDSETARGLAGMGMANMGMANDMENGNGRTVIGTRHNRQRRSRVSGGK